MNPPIIIDHVTFLDLVHDRWFDLGAMRFDHDGREFTLLFGDHRRGPHNEKALTISDVVDVAVHDDARIQVYDIATVEVDESTSSIHILSGFPLKIVLTYGHRCEVHVSDYRKRRELLARSSG